MKALKRLLIATLTAMPLLSPLGADAAELVLRRVDIAVGLPIPVPVIVPEVRHRQPEVVYIRDAHDRYRDDRDRYSRNHDRHYRDRDHRHDRGNRKQWNRHDRGNYRGDGKRQVVVIDRKNRRNCNSSPETVVITDRRRW